MARTYKVYVLLGQAEQVEPFDVSARLSWTWDALQAARTATTEEDTLAEFVGDEHRHMDTERPWLRVDVALNATLPWGSPLPLPPPAQWRRWVAEVARRLDPLLSTHWERRDDDMMILAHRAEPEAEVQPDADGQLLLTGVKLEAWEGIDLPREWDDPDREEEDPHEQLADFVGRMWNALRAWNQTLTHLLPH